MDTKPFHPFRSARAKERYLKRYDERAAAWPVPCRTRTVETAAGETFMRISGPDDAPALILLPSASSPSLIWMPNIEELSKSFRVYALDNIYDVGRSVYRTPFKTPDDYTGWLDGVFDALGIRGDLSLMGLSYGAWLTAQYALRFAKRLRAIVMAAPPATIQPLPGAWAWYGLSALIPHRFFMKNMLRWMFPALSRLTDEASVKLAQDLVEDAFVGLRCFKLKMPVAPTVLSDEELKKISEVPALFLVGQHEVIYPAENAIKRLTEAAPKIKAAIIPDAGHDLTIVQARMVSTMAANFIGTFAP
jgi:pimeloyl-ACP methyl ester carboxylesterase